MARRYAFTIGLIWSLALVVFLMAAGGCARWNWRGKGYNDQDTTWARKMRPPADEKQFSGLDARAQDIERDLGVR
ncbi:MAG TPA: hypothetical protein VHV08_04595 [Pirellulales bacterium]|jgi:hypothetical protein|nr:hypothetical protein [Pirellulales bacterium]